MILDLAVAVAAGGEHLSDIAILRAEPGVFGHVASEPTVSRTLTTLAANAPKVVSALRSAHHHACGSAWRAAGVLIEALKQLPFDPGFRVGRKVLVRADSGGGTHEFLDYLTRRHLQYSVGFTLNETTAAAVDSIPASAWTPAYDSQEDVRDGAWVAELIGLIDLSGWPPGMRVIVRNEKPHPGAQLRFCDRDGLRLTAFATNTTTGQLPVLELRQRRRARCEDRIKSMKDTGLRGLPLHGFDQNRIWIEIACLATELITWMQMLAFDTTPARRWAPKTLRLRLFSAAAASPTTPGGSIYGSASTGPGRGCH